MSSSPVGSWRQYSLQWLVSKPCVRIRGSRSVTITCSRMGVRFPAIDGTSEGVQAFVARSTTPACTAPCEVSTPQTRPPLATTRSTRTPRTVRAPLRCAASSRPYTSLKGLSCPSPGVHFAPRTCPRSSAGAIALRSSVANISTGRPSARWVSAITRASVSWPSSVSRSSEPQRSHSMPPGSSDWSASSRSSERQV